MKHLSTNYWTFINEANTAAPKKSTIDYDKINSLKEHLKSLESKLRLERDDNKRKKLQYGIKIAELRILIAQVP